MDRDIFLNQYWNYYKMLEDDFIRTIRFIEIDESNYKVFSVEYVKQLQAICSEIDVIFKAISEFHGYTDLKKMHEYASMILGKYNEIGDKIINVKYKKDIEIKPFLSWSGKSEYSELEWWSGSNGYNGVKHNRVVNFKNANLKNVINALAGLFLLEMYFLKEICKNTNCDIDIPNKESSLFIIKDWKTKAIGALSGVIVECDNES